MKDHISSYRDLPQTVFQFQNKFRNETRAKSGIMRGREFLMKDLYDFSSSEEEHNTFYAQARTAYIKIFDRLGIGHQTYVTYASGGIFSEFSEEFQTVSEAGEDTIYIDEAKGIALNEEVYTDEVIEKLGLKKDTLVKKKAIESGNIFHLGTKFSEPLGLHFLDEAGQQQPVYMGSYGIGPSRVMGTIVEVLADEKGIVWPEAVAPFRVHLVGLNLDDDEVRDWADATYDNLTAAGVEVLYDDRIEARAGEKFADSDLIGLPHRVVVSRKGKEAGTYEVVERQSGEVRALTEEELFNDFAV